MTYTAKALVTWTLVILFVLALASFAYANTTPLIRGPQIEVTSPLAGSTATSSLVTVRGTAENISYISMNDRQIFVDERGQFREQLLLYPGYNIITIYAQDRFDRQRKQVIEVVHIPQ